MSLQIAPIIEPRGRILLYRRGREGESEKGRKRERKRGRERERKKEKVCLHILFCSSPKANPRVTQRRKTFLGRW